MCWVGIYQLSEKPRACSEVVSAAIKLRCQFGQGDSRHEGGLGTPLSLGSAQVSSRCKMQCVHVSCLGVYLCVCMCV